MENRGEIPSLESVTRGMRPVVVWVLLIGLPVLAGGLYAAGLAGRVGSLATSVATVSIITWVAVIATILITWGDSRYETSPEGLTVRGLTYTRSVRWSDIDSVQADYNGWFTLSAADISLQVHLNDLHLMVSIWQHLRRYGLEKALYQWKPAKEFLSPIPEDLPEEFVWENPKPPKLFWLWYTATTIYICIIIAFIIYVLIAREHSNPFNYLLVFLVISMRRYWKSPLLIARRVIATPDKLIIDLPHERKEARWEDIRSAIRDKTRADLLINKRTVHIPVRSGDKSAEYLVWVISQRLRFSSKLMVFMMPDTFNRVGKIL